MPQKIDEVMSRNPICADAEVTLAECARMMREADVGDVIVTQDGNVCGILTDRDITIRGIAEGKDPKKATAGEICSRELLTMRPKDSVDEAIRCMRERAIRRIPIVEDGKAVGIVSLGDLAQERDPQSALADISAAPPNE